jgi:transcriptional regulator with XRE-family HTH domain
MEIKVKIGIRIKALRELKGMSQKDLAYESKIVNKMIGNVKSNE